MPRPAVCDSWARSLLTELTVIVSRNCLRRMRSSPSTALSRAALLSYSSRSSSRMAKAPSSVTKLLARPPTRTRLSGGSRFPRHL
jgi:hypothetical protein